MEVGLTIALLVLIVFSGYFSATETAYTSLSKIKLKNMMQKKNKRAELVYKQSENYDRVLSTILVGNNIVNIASATIGTILFSSLLGGELGPTISTVVITIVVLIFGEVMPKSVAKEFPEKFAMFSAPILTVFIYLFIPLTMFFSGLKKITNKLFKNKGENRSITEDELITIVEESESGGVLDEHESELIRSAIEFNDLEAMEILVPRVDIVAIDIHTPLEEISQIFRESGYSRLPVYEESIDNVVGFIHEKDFYMLLYKKGKNIKSIVQKIIYTAPTIKISVLLRQLQLEKCHMAIVIDEYGGTKGMVTMEDILEELVGEIWDEHDERVENITQHDDGTYEVLGSMNIEDMFQYFDLEVDDDEFLSVSVSGWISEVLNKMPEINDEITFENLYIKVLAMDGRRVHSILVKPLEKPKEEEEKKGLKIVDEIKKNLAESSEEED